jgi:hypothetical protein
MRESGNKRTSKGSWEIEDLERDRRADERIRKIEKALRESRNKNNSKGV